MQTRVDKALGQRRPVGQPDDASPANPLLELRRQIAALRLRSDAAKKMPPDESRPAISDLPMVPIFATPLAEVESLNGDRDTAKREERIRKVLAERGALRLLGAVASPELERAISALYDSHPNFLAATDYVLGELALARQKGRAVTGLRLLLAGDAGTGKTDYALTLSEILGVPSHVIGMSSAQAAAALAGSETYWSNSEPGQIWKSIVQGEYANKIIIMDELEKSAQSWGDPGGALYQALEPRTAAVFRDKCVPWMEIDASRVCWIATVNSPEHLHPAIRSRFVEVQVGAPSDASLRDLAQRLYGNLLAEFGLDARFPDRLSRDSENALIGTSVRDAKRMLRAALAAALRANADEVVVGQDRKRDLCRRIGFI
jgi:ATP-dependent Lon protease